MDPKLNPYKLLQVSRTADSETIEDAYDRLFDKYEPRAQAGDSSAVAMLENLNEAHDLLLDPARRAALDRSLAEANRQISQAHARRAGTAPAPDVRPKASRTATAPTTSRPGSHNGAASSRGTRPRAVAPARRQFFSPLYFVIGAVLMILVVFAVSYIVSYDSNNGGGQGNTSGLQPTPYVPNAVELQATATAEAILSDTFDISQQPTPAAIGGVSTSDPNRVVATVNGQPVYMYELSTRYIKDLIIAASDPIMGPLLASQDVTATRMLDIISQDSLDKLINMQVIVQQAQKEGLYPSDQDINTLVDQAKQVDLKGTPFPDFLAKNRITEQQYRTNVVRNIVYAVMASKHVPAQGTDDEKQNAFLSWICDTRKGYDVKVLLNFTQSNQPCSSGLPSDIPLSSMPPSQDNGQQPPPEPVQTGTP